MRWASTWSAPFCESSSTTRISELFQIDECEIVVDDLAEAPVVVGDVGVRGALPGGKALGVVERQR